MNFVASGVSRIASHRREPPPREIEIGADSRRLRRFLGARSVGRFLMQFKFQKAGPKKLLSISCLFPTLTDTAPFDPAGEPVLPGNTHQTHINNRSHEEQHESE